MNAIQVYKIKTENNEKTETTTTIKKKIGKPKLDWESCSTLINTFAIEIYQKEKNIFKKSTYATHTLQFTIFKWKSR